MLHSILHLCTGVSTLIYIHLNSSRTWIIACLNLKWISVCWVEFLRVFNRVCFVGLVVCIFCWMWCVQLWVAVHLIAWNDVLCVTWDVKLYSLTLTLLLSKYIWHVLPVNHLLHTKYNTDVSNIFICLIYARMRCRVFPPHPLNEDENRHLPAVTWQHRDNDIVH